MSLKTVFVTSATQFTSKKTGKPQVCINGSIFFGLGLLKQAGVKIPQLLRGTKLTVEFFDPGETLLNNTICRDSEMIVKSIASVDEQALVRQASAFEVAERMMPTMNITSDNNRTPQEDGEDVLPSAAETITEANEVPAEVIDGNTVDTTTGEVTAPAVEMNEELPA